MVRIKLEKNKKEEPVFKLYIKDFDIEKYRFLKRALIESKKGKEKDCYIVPIRFFEPIFRNIPKEDIKVDKRSILFYLEFSDDYDEKYYYRTSATATYMKKWREEGCPNIYKINLNIEEASISKEIAFKRISLNNIIEHEEKKDV